MQNEIVIGYGIAGSGSNSVTLGTASTLSWTGLNNGNIALGNASQAFKDLYLTNGRLFTGSLATAPASGTAAGTIGDVKFSANYIYVCTTTGGSGAAVWKRATLTAF